MIYVYAVLWFIAYFIPSMVASQRGVRVTPAIVALNLLTGWTGIGWVASLVWALAAPTK